MALVNNKSKNNKLTSQTGNEKSRILKAQNLLRKLIKKSEEVKRARKGLRNLTSKYRKEEHMLYGVFSNREL